MSKLQAMKEFFAIVASDSSLQKRLFETDKIGEVSNIAKEHGFSISAVDILRTQAGRSILLPEAEQKTLAAGKKPQTGAQWGRNGRGYLDAAGYWVIKFIEWDVFPPANEAQMESFLSRVSEDKELKGRLRQAKTYDEVARLAGELGFEFSSLLLLKFMASQVLRIDDALAWQLVEGGDTD